MTCCGVVGVDVDVDIDVDVVIKTKSKYKCGCPEMHQSASPLTLCFSAWSRDLA